MRWIVNMFRARLSASLRQFQSWLFVLLAVALSLVPVLSGGERPERLMVAVVVEDTGALGQKLVRYVQSDPDLIVVQLDRREAMRRLAADKLEAVFVVRPDFTQKLSQADFKDTVELFTSPSSSASSTAAEPIVNGTMRIWIEETAVLRARAYLTERGYPYTAEDEAKQRDQIEKTWTSGEPLVIRSHIATNAKGEEQQTQEKTSPLTVCAAWYAAFAAFYLIASASYALDISKQSLSERMRATGARLSQLLLGAGLAQLLLCLIGFVAALAAACVLSRESVLAALSLLPPMLCYLVGMIGLTLFVASMVRHTISLLLLAPLLTFANAVLGGLLVKLPDWAALLESISRALPARTFFSAISSAYGVLVPLPLVVVCAAWLAAGLLMSTLLRGGIVSRSGRR